MAKIFAICVFLPFFCARARLNINAELEVSIYFFSAYVLLSTVVMHFGKLLEPSPAYNA